MGCCAHRHSLPVMKVLCRQVAAPVVQRGSKQLLHVGRLVDGVLEAEGLLRAGRGGRVGRRC